MSTFARLASGNAAGFIAMLFNIFVQVALVPVFLHFWDPHRYGVWIALTTAITFITLADAAHLDFLAFECMRVPVEDRERRSQIFSDALPVLAVTGVIELGLLAAFLRSHFIFGLFGVPEGSDLLDAVRLALFGLMLLWVTYQAPVSLLGRVLSSVGHFPATVWWQMGTTMGQTITPAVAVALGAGFGGAILAYVFGTALAYALACVHYRSLARREHIVLRRPNIWAGFRRLRSALLLALANLLDFLQQAGFRLLLLPLIGTARLVQFSTIRTVANIAQMGLAVLTNPTVPELMRFVSARDDFRSGVLMTATLYVTVMLMCPGFVVLQALAPPLFNAWTLGKVSFDSPTFALLSTAVLIFCLSQPNRAIVRGNNLVCAQTVVSIAASVVVAVCGYLGTRTFGIIGAAGALVIAEIVRSGLNVVVSVRWFRLVGLNFPMGPMLAASGCVLMTILVILAMAARQSLTLFLAATYVPMWVAMNAVFWAAVRAEARVVVRRALKGSWQKLSRQFRPSLG